MAMFFSFVTTVFMFQHGSNLPRNIIVVGPESSGTRYLARSLSRAIIPNNGWDGQTPACWNDSPSHHVHHISLPWGLRCTIEGVIRVNQSIKTTTDFCLFTTLSNSRVSVNLTSLLSREPDARAIVVVRSGGFAYVSGLHQKYCAIPSVLKKEQVLAYKIIRKALDLVPDQILLVEYEELWHFPAYTWRRIYHHVALSVDKIIFEPFRNGNKLYNVSRNWS